MVKDLIILRLYWDNGNDMETAISGLGFKV